MVGLALLIAANNACKLFGMEGIYTSRGGVGTVR